MAFMMSPSAAKKLNKKLEKTGTGKTASDMSIMGLIITILVTVVLSLVGFLFPKAGIKLFPSKAVALSGLVSVSVYLAIGILTALMLIYVFIMLKVMNRRKQIEAVLADYLQMVSANVQSGLPIDQAMWYAVRPQFGILSKEIETVAKKTMTGSELDSALMEFADRYESDTLRKSMILLIEGLKAGGAVGNLLNKISYNIKETEIMRKEMASSVTVYSIFIMFSTLIAAPLLFSVSNQLIVLMTELLSTVDLGSIENTLGQSQLPLNIGNIEITPEGFQRFVLAMLAISASFASLLIATVKRGDYKEGIKWVPIYVGLSIVIFIIFRAIFSKVIGGIVV